MTTAKTETLFGGDRDIDFSLIVKSVLFYFGAEEVQKQKQPLTQEGSHTDKKCLTWTSITADIQVCVGVCEEARGEWSWIQIEGKA